MHILTARLCGLKRIKFEMDYLVSREYLRLMTREEENI
jgi:hypothetical protein